MMLRINVGIRGLWVKNLQKWFMCVFIQRPTQSRSTCWFNLFRTFKWFPRSMNEPKLNLDLKKYFPQIFRQRNVHQPCTRLIIYVHRCLETDWARQGDQMLLKKRPMPSKNSPKCGQSFIVKFIALFCEKWATCVIFTKIL
jgi:hypothetical protein